MTMSLRWGSDGIRILVWTVLACLFLHCSYASAESLYDERTYRPLGADVKAYRVGDILTVQVFESSSASSSADTGTHRKGGASVDLSLRGTSAAKAGIGIGGDFEGGGKTQRANRLLVTLTVTIREILPNGDFRVSGEQTLTVNEEPQKVTLEGRVRAVDISDTNVVPSSRLADAKITYVGEGDVAERNRRPWWRKLLDWIGF